MFSTLSTRVLTITNLEPLINLYLSADQKIGEKNDLRTGSVTSNIRSYLN